jgi:hypothetical protein
MTNSADGRDRETTRPTGTRTRRAAGTSLRLAFLLALLVSFAFTLSPGASASAPASGVKQFDACLQNADTGAPACASGLDTSLPGGSTAHLSLTVTNEPVSNTTLGSVNLDAPSDLPIDPASVHYTAGTGTFGALTSGEIQLRDLNLPSGSSVTVTFDVTTPCTGSGLQWQIYAKQSNRFNGTGNDFAEIDGTGLASDIAAGSCHVAFLTQPKDTQVGSTITDTPYAPTGGPIEVGLENAAGTLLTSCPVADCTVTVDRTPSLGVLGGSLQAPLVYDASAGGLVATFADLSIGLGNGLSSTDLPTSFALTASGVGTTATSDAFSVALTGEACTTSGCPSFTTQLGNGTVLQSSATGSVFTFLSTNTDSIPPEVTQAGHGCANFVSLGAGAVEENDGRTGPGGTLLFTYAIPTALVQAAPDNGQPHNPICAGSAPLDLVTGQPVRCDSPAAVGPWLGDALDPITHTFNGAQAYAVCEPDGLYWGILGSFQDKAIDPGANPTVTGWKSDTNFRYYDISVPFPWDIHFGG